MRYTLSLLALYFCFLSLEAQDPKLIQFNESSGFYSLPFLLDGQIDSEGKLWIVAGNGVIKYDGDEFTNIKVSGRKGLLLKFKEQNGIKYLIDYFGWVYLIDPDTDSISPYPHNDLIDSLKKGSIYRDTYFDKEGALHASFPGIGYCVIQKDGTIVKPLDSIPLKGFGSVLILKNKTVFNTLNLREGKNQRRKMLLLDQHLNVLDSLSISRTHFSPYCTATLKDRIVHSDGVGNLVTIDSDSVIKLIQYDYPITNLIVDHQSNLWVSTEGGGIHFFKEGIVDLSERRVFFQSKDYRLVTFDLENGAWLISNTEGLLYSPSMYFTYYTTKEGLSTNRVRKVKEYGDSIYVCGHSNRISIINRKTNSISLLKALPNEKPNSVINDLYINQKNGRVWAALRGKIYYQNNNRWHSALAQIEAIKNKTYFISFFDLQNNSHGYSHAITYQNNIVFMKDTLIAKVVASPKIQGRIHNVIEYLGSYYAATDRKFYRLKGDSIIALDSIYPELDAPVTIRKKFNDKIYFGVMGKGIFVLDEEKLDTFKMINTSNSATVAVNIDSTELWFFNRMNTILMRLDSSEGKKRQISYKKYAPFPRNYDLSVVGTQEGFYARTFNRGVLFRPKSFIETQALTLANIHEFSFKANEQHYSNTDSIYHFDHTMNLISFQYKLISYQAFPITYRYRLKGLKETWTVSNKGQVQFTNLNDGEYTFEVQARKGEQLWSHTKSLSFSVSPPYWETWWFRLLLIIILTTILYWFINRQAHEKDLIISQLNLKQKMLRAKMDPHFIFNIISSVQYFILEKKNDKALWFLKRFTALMRNTLNQMDLEWIDLETEVSFLREYMDLEQFRMNNQFEYTIKLEVSDPRVVKIPTFLVQPLVENAIFHGLKNKQGKGNLALSFIEEKDLIRIIVEDNGIGLIPTEHNKHLGEPSHGLKTIKDRLELYNKHQLKDSFVMGVGTNNIGIKVELKLKK